MAKNKRPSLEDREAFLDLSTAVAKALHGEEQVADVYDPVFQMAVDAQDPALTTLQRSALNDKVASFLYPKKKAVDVKADGFAQPTIQIVTYQQPKVIAHDAEGERPTLPASGGPAADERDRSGADGVLGGPELPNADGPGD